MSDPADLTPSPTAVRRALARARDGKALDVTETEVLLGARGEQLETLLEHAARVRDAGLEAAGRPGVITYSRKVFIPLTRLCRDRCGYCTFATVPGRLDAPYLSPQPVRRERNQPAYVVHTARFVAERRGMPYEQLEALVERNAAGLFGW